MKILLIRHGDPDYAIDSLTEKGWREAKLLSNRLEKLEIRDFYVSPLGRARATVQPTLEKLNRTAEVLPWLAEFRGWVEDPFGQPEPQPVEPDAAVLDEVPGAVRPRPLDGASADGDGNAAPDCSGNQ